MLARIAQRISGLIRSVIVSTLAVLAKPIAGVIGLVYQYPALIPVLRKLISPFPQLSIRLVEFYATHSVGPFKGETSVIHASIQPSTNQAALSAGAIRRYKQLVAAREQRESK